MESGSLLHDLVHEGATIRLVPCRGRRLQLEHVPREDLLHLVRVRVGVGVGIRVRGRVRDLLHLVGARRVSGCCRVVGWSGGPHGGARDGASPDGASPHAAVGLDLTEPWLGLGLGLVLGLGLGLGFGSAST